MTPNSLQSHLILIWFAFYLHLIRIWFAFYSNQMHLNKVQVQMWMNQMQVQMWMNQMQVQMHPPQGNQMQVQVPHLHLKMQMHFSTSLNQANCSSLYFFKHIYCCPGNIEYGPKACLQSFNSGLTISLYRVTINPFSLFYISVNHSKNLVTPRISISTLCICLYAWYF